MLWVEPTSNVLHDGSLTIGGQLSAKHGPQVPVYKRVQSLHSLLSVQSPHGEHKSLLQALLEVSGLEQTGPQSPECDPHRRPGADQM